MTLSHVIRAMLLGSQIEYKRTEILKEKSKSFRSENGGKPTFKRNRRYQMKHNFKSKRA